MNTSFQSVKLEEIEFVCRHVINKDIFQDLDIKLYEDCMRNMVLEMKTHILGQTKIDTYNVEFSYPKNAWNTFKQDRMPKWFNKKFPIQYKIEVKTIKCDCKVLFPELKTPLPGMGQVYYTMGFYEGIGK